MGNLSRPSVFWGGEVVAGQLATIKPATPTPRLRATARVSFLYHDVSGGGANNSETILTR